MSIESKIKGFLGNIGVSSFQDKPPVKKRASYNKTSRQNKNGSTKPKTQQNTAQPPRKNQGGRLASSVKTIRTVDEVPKFNYLVSHGEHNPPAVTHMKSLLLTEEQKRHCIVLDSTSISQSASKKHCYFLHSFDSSGLGNNVLLNLLTRCQKELGYNQSQITIIKTTHDLIKILYSRYQKTVVDGQDIDPDGELADYFDSLLIDALKAKSSDLHIEIRETVTDIRLRINGNLMSYTNIEVARSWELAQVIYTVLSDEGSKETSFDPKRPQASTITRTIDVDGRQTKITVRLNTLPAGGGCIDFIMRLLVDENEGANPEDIERTTLETLGYSQKQVLSINIGLSKPVGCTLISGVTGSGKSTTIKVMLTNLIYTNLNEDGKTSSIKVITVEDPVEYHIPLTTQVGVVRNKNDEGKNPFIETVRAAVRADPDVLMIGETRDNYSANLLVSATQTGHKTFTTTHTPSAIGTISRLRDLGVANSVLGSNDFIASLIYQTLVPINCPDCSLTYEEFLSNKEKETMSEEVSIEFEGFISRLELITNGDFSSLRFKNIKGCNKCQSGVIGREVVAEVIIPDEYMLDCFRLEDDNKALQYFIDNGGMLIIDHGIEKVLKGFVDPVSAEKKLGRLIPTKRRLKEEPNFNVEKLNEEYENTHAPS